MNALPFVTLKVFTPLVEKYGNLQIKLSPLDVSRSIKRQSLPPRVTDELLIKIIIFH